ncbi:MAG: aminodeoxychorismate/anthranilate synthase component II [Planctomycetales bacterium]|nr:aminodeoxychorismate/anthranilate synthase component II [Planctomycetales bacterium]
MLLLIDNYDSFVHNLARYLRRLGQQTLVVRNDELAVADVRALAPRAIVISPGPCTPDEAGISREVVQQLHAAVPILGVCLGHQAIAAAFGADVIRAPEPVHGRASAVRHDGQGLFGGLPNPLEACRYHSLIVDAATLPDELAPCAWTVEDDVLMSIRHRSLPLFGVQFHPESVLTPAGYGLLSNFLTLAGLPAPAQSPDLFAERPLEPIEQEPLDPPIYY